MVHEMRRAVFLDRDGVLNRVRLKEGKPYPPTTLEELELTPGVSEDLLALRNLGFLLVVVTNQPDIARGLQSAEVAGEINSRLRRDLPIDDLLVCPHDDKDGCDCRKPKPGLLLRAAERYGIDLRNSYMIGDRWRDVEAGRNAGCRTIWLDCHYDERGPSQKPDVSVSSLGQAVDFIVNDEGCKENL